MRWSVKADPGMSVVRQRLADPPPDNPARMRAHPGREWLVVLSGTAVLLLGNRRFRIETNQSAEFPTMLPHAIGAEGGPVRDPGPLRPRRPPRPPARRRFLTSAVATVKMGRVLRCRGRQAP